MNYTFATIRRHKRIKLAICSELTVCRQKLGIKSEQMNFELCFNGTMRVLCSSIDLKKLAKGPEAGRPIRGQYPTSPRNIPVFPDKNLKWRFYQL